MTTPTPRAVVLAGGEIPPAATLPPILAEDDPLLIAADSGLDHAVALGITVELVVGDLDSASPAAVAAARAAGIAFETHPTAKDATDLELAIAAAATRGARRVTVVGGGGGRHDHLLANALLLAHPRFADLDLDAYVGTAHIVVARSRVDVRGRIGARCSLIPVGGIAGGVRTQGLEYPLHGEDLVPGSTRGISNEMLADTATVELTSGVLLVVQPHFLVEPHPDAG